jgi:hypothetical protein
MVETDVASEPDQALDMSGIGHEIESVSYLPHTETVHKLTHQNLHLRFSEIRLKGTLENGIPIASLNDFPMPAALVKFVGKHWK